MASLSVGTPQSASTASPQGLWRPLSALPHQTSLLPARQWWGNMRKERKKRKIRQKKDKEVKRRIKAREEMKKKEECGKGVRKFKKTKKEAEKIQSVFVEVMLLLRKKSSLMETHH